VRSGEERRQEERQALDVVGMGVADEEVRADRAAAREGDPELPRSGPAIEDEERPVVGAGLDARCVAAVASGLGTGRRDGPPDAPESDADAGFIR
jgi:hypothetical protein